MEIILTLAANEDLIEWKKSGNKNVLQRIRKLIESIKKTPFAGIGKPEPLKYDLTGKWSRRITNEDRLVYEVENEIINIYSLKGHYKNNNR